MGFKNTCGRILTAVNIFLNKSKVLKGYIYLFQIETIVFMKFCYYMEVFAISIKMFSYFSKDKKLHISVMKSVKTVKTFDFL